MPGRVSTNSHMPTNESLPLSRPPLESWKTPLMDIPERFRDAMLEYAYREHDRVGKQDFTGRPDLEKAIAKETTGLSPLLYASFLPYHLLDPQHNDEAKKLLATKGPGELMAFILAHAPDADTLLVVGDQPLGDHITQHLDSLLAENPVRVLVAGPGPQVENVLRGYAAVREISRSHVQAMDESNGEVWSQGPGPKLEDLVLRLFKEKRPTRVIAFEPVRLPSTLIALEAARALELPIEQIAAPSLRRAPSSSF